MARRPKPWFRKSHSAWFVTIGGVQNNLGRDKKLAYERFYELMGQPKQPQQSPTARVDSRSITAIVNAFLDWSRKHRSPDTVEWYRYRLERFVDRYPDLCVGELKPFHAQQWVDSYPDLSVTSRRNYLRTIKRCLAWAVKQGYLDKSPLAILEVPAGECREVVIEPEEFEKLLSFCRDDNFRDLIVVTWETGCRPQESLRVEAHHVDVANQRWVFPRKSSKGKKKPRIVYLNDKAWEITQKLMQRNPTGPLFRNAGGIPWSTEAVNCAFSRLQSRMGRVEMATRKLKVDDETVAALIPTLNSTRKVHGRTVKKTEAERRWEARRKLTNRLAASLAPRYSLYAIRHSWATRALKLGLDGLTVAILMGHSDPSTLARVYQHLAHDPQHLLNQAKRASPKLSS
jgi:integrase